MSSQGKIEQFLSQFTTHPHCPCAINGKMLQLRHPNGVYVDLLQGATKIITGKLFTLSVPIVYQQKLTYILHAN